jgi:hypothetical protein
MKLWTLSTVWYLFLGYMRENFPLDKIPTRNYVTTSVKKLCDKVGISRAFLGIITGARAELYFDGEWNSVSFDSIEELAAKGTDIVFIEKQGVPEILTEWADKYGIAMVNTRGHLTEYGKDLMNAADRAGAHVVIMADYDAHGVKIASEAPTEIPWIGANDKMLEYFNLDRNLVKIQSESQGAKDYIRRLVRDGEHPKGLREGEKDNRFKDVDVDFLDYERVELDAILAQVGDERFFQYIIDALKEIWPKRDYNRSIEMNDLILLEVPDEKLGERLEHEDVIIKINDKIQSFTKPKLDEIKEELKDTTGFLEVKEKRKEIKKRFGEILTKDANYRDFTYKLTELVESHPFFNGSGDGHTGREPPG